MFAGTLLYLGVHSDILLGDEIHHIQGAKEISTENCRLAYSETVSNWLGKPLKLQYSPGWHTLVSIGFAMTGNAPWVPQLVQAIFYFILLLAVWLATDKLYDRTAAWFAWLIAATMPVLVVYSILLYQDVPGLAMLFVALAFFSRGKFLASGICLAIAFYIKLNMLPWGGWLAVWAFWYRPNPSEELTIKKRFFNFSKVALPVIIIFITDMVWRRMTLGNFLAFGVEKRAFLIPHLNVFFIAFEEAFKKLGCYNSEYVDFYKSPNSFFNIKQSLEHWGFLMLFGITALFYIKKYRVWTLFGLLANIAFFAILIRGSNCRYLIPVLAVFVPIMGAGLAKLYNLPIVQKQKITKLLLVGILVSIGLVQYVAASMYTYNKRKISTLEKQGYAWAKENLPKEKYTLFSERSLQYYAGVKTLRSPALFYNNHDYAIFSNKFLLEMPAELCYLFFRGYNISHFASVSRRQYCCKQEGLHDYGWANEVIEKLSTLPFFEVQYKNDDILFLKFKPSKKWDEKSLKKYK